MRVFNHSSSELVALVPDYRARIAEVRFSKPSIYVRIESLAATEDVIVGKAYLENARGGKEHVDLAFQDGACGFPVAGLPRNLLIVLIPKDGVEIIDEWSLNFGMPFQSGLVTETSTEDLELMISAGESETVEFKATMLKPEALAKLIGSFANGGGGRLFIGVDDDGQIVGITDAKTMKDDITRLLDHHCTPSPAFQVDRVTIRDRQVMVLSVPQGTDRPYVSDGVVYVRSGATSRPASRYELDQLYGSQSKPPRF